VKSMSHSISLPCPIRQLGRFIVVLLSVMLMLCIVVLFSLATYLALVVSAGIVLLDFVRSMLRNSRQPEN
jgi:hypothetical protein